MIGIHIIYTYTHPHHLVTEKPVIQGQFSSTSSPSVAYSHPSCWTDAASGQPAQQELSWPPQQQWERWLLPQTQPGQTSCCCWKGGRSPLHSDHGHFDLLHQQHSGCSSSWRSSKAGEMMWQVYWLIWLIQLINVYNYWSYYSHALHYRHWLDLYMQLLLVAWLFLFL